VVDRRKVRKMKNLDYVELNYTPDKNDLICEFYVEPVHMSLKEAAGEIAAESSIGTWIETKTTKQYVKRLAAKVFEINGNNIKIAYPAELFEPGNMPNILSSVAGNVFGLKGVKNLRLNDIHFPERLLKSFKGPKYGIDGIRKLLKISQRPLLGTIIKPKLGLRTEDHAKVAYEAWIGGVDIVKDDENLSSQAFNKFKKRLEKTLKMKKLAEKETGEKKVYIINVTAETEEMLRRAKMVESYGNEYIMVDIITVGWSSLQTLRNKNFNLVLHAHRAGHGAITRNPNHGIAMKVIAKLARIIGVDQLHIGTVVGKMFETKKEVLENCIALKEKMWKFKQVMPVASGGLHVRHIPELLKIFGCDVVIQMGGGIHALGTKTGAKAVRDALEATLQNIPLNEYARTHPELKKALEKFKFS
jgi:ribulose-bisphosphate carboxylase large chain